MQVYSWGRVHPDYRGLGIGTTLLAWEEERAREAIAKAPAEAKVSLGHGANSKDEGGKEKAKRHQVESARINLPVSTYKGVWNGGDLLIDRSNVKNASPYELRHTDDPAGTPLRVAHAYGIDYLRLRASTGKTMVILFADDAETAFRADVVLTTGEAYTVHSHAEEAPVVIESPDQYREICIVVTRGESSCLTQSRTPHKLCRK